MINKKYITPENLVKYCSGMAVWSRNAHSNHDHYYIHHDHYYIHGPCTCPENLDGEEYNFIEIHTRTIYSANDTAWAIEHFYPENKNSPINQKHLQAIWDKLEKCISGKKLGTRLDLIE